jgi:hypothetical protein
MLANHAAVAGIYDELTPAERNDMARILQRLMKVLQARAFGEGQGDS